MIKDYNFLHRFLEIALFEYQRFQFLVTRRKGHINQTSAWLHNQAFTMATVSTIFASCKRYKDLSKPAGTLRMSDFINAENPFRGFICMFFVRLGQHK